MKGNIYCYGCEHSAYYLSTQSGNDECNAPENINSKKKYFGISIKHIRRPEKINKNNDCKWFKPREYR